MLGAELTQKEIRQTVYELNDAKSHGIDGFTAEFYNKFWPLLQDRYADSFSHSKNLYKEKGDTDYRPISLINVDRKILTKALTNRLRKVLPSLHANGGGWPKDRQHRAHTTRSHTDSKYRGHTPRYHLFGPRKDI